MRLTPRTSLLVALLVGAIATLLFRGLVQTAAQSSSEAGGSIVVARTEVPFGARLTAANLREVPWRGVEPLAGSFATIDELLRDGRRLATASLQRNEPILASRITGPNGRSTLSTQLDEGMRAVTVRVDEVRGVAGFVAPGDRVDVILTRGEGGGQDGGAYADVLLQGAKVLAVDQLSDERADKPAVARAVTLELNAQQAQQVVLAQGIGRLSLALRQANGFQSEAAARVTADDLGLRAGAARERMADLEKRLAAEAEAARRESERVTAQKLSDLEARMRSELARPAQPIIVPGVQPQRQAPKGSVVTVTRDGTKTESYSVATER